MDTEFWAYNNENVIKIQELCQINNEFKVTTKSLPLTNIMNVYFYNFYFLKIIQHGIMDK